VASTIRRPPAADIPGQKKRSREILEELSLLLLSALLFALAFPNFLYRWGFFPLAYIALVPAFVVIHRAGWVRIFPYGLFYGFACYAIFNYWLTTWSAWGIFVVPSIYAVYFVLLLPVLKIIDHLFPRHGYFFQTLAWVGYEYLRIQFFLGYPYGILGYTQYPFLPLVRFASVAGMWGITFLVVFPSAFVARLLRGPGMVGALRRRWPAAAAYVLVFTAAVAYGGFTKMDLSEAPTWRVALIQQNIDPWRGDEATYEKALDVNIRLSTQALEQDPDIVVWSETSIVPSISYHTRYRESERRYRIIRGLMEFLDGQDVSYVVGNNFREKRVLHTGEESEWSYNATFLYREAEVVDVYKKLRLVPFSEHFPYRGILTWMHKIVASLDVHPYDAGSEYVVFEDGGVRFSTPICFEDSFGYLNRNFVREGADVLVNMTNDSWASSVVCEIQHTTMAVFRATENRRSMVRSTNSGITCVIDPNGRITHKIAPFAEGCLVADVPVIRTETTLYTRWGDWFAYLGLGVGAASAVVGALLLLLRRKTSSQKGRRE